MTISSVLNRASYTSNGVTTGFGFPYKFFSAADIVVLTTDALGNTLTKALTTDYLISGTQDSSGAFPGGGTITFNVAPVTGLTITLYRDPALLQSTQLVDNDPLPALTLNNALDLLTTIVQRDRDIVTRSLRQPDSDVSTINAIPAATLRANGGLGSVAGYDSVGNTTIYSAPGQSVSVSAAMAPVVTAVDLPTARTAMGLGSAATKNGTLADESIGQGLEDDGSKNLRVKLDTTTDGSSALLRGANGVKVDPSFFRGFIDGFEVGAPGGANVITIGPGVCIDSTNTHFIKITTTFTKSLASFAAGTGNGGLDTGTTLGAINTPYFILAILNPTTGATDYILSLSATAPTLPTGFTIFRVVGWDKTDGSKNLLQIQQRGDKFIYGATVIDANAITVGTTAVLTTLTVPAGFQVDALIRVQFANAAAGAALLINSPDEANVVASTAGNRSLITNSGTNAIAGHFEVRTDITGEIRTRSDTATCTVSIGTYGFLWSRGRNI